MKPVFYMRRWRELSILSRLLLRNLSIRPGRGKYPFRPIGAEVLAMRAAVRRNLAAEVAPRCFEITELGKMAARKAGPPGGWT